MIKLGIVGSSELAEEQRNRAIQEIYNLLRFACYFYGKENITLVSGGAKGIDEIAENLAVGMGIQTDIKNPEHDHWPRKGTCELGENCHGFKWRNRLIGDDVNILFNYVVKTDCQTCKGSGKEYSHNGPDGFRLVPCKACYCYHCFENGHVVSGGCYTMKYTESLNKPVHRLDL